MKKLITLFLLLCATTLFAQVPEKFSYQAVVRNASNSLVTDAPVGVRVSILQGSADGSAVYVETHTATTNANGLLTVEIGGGKAEQGEFAGIDWANGPYFLKTETDPNGGSNYTVTSTQQVLSVPYALYAKEAANSFSGDYNDLKNKPAIPQNVGELANDVGYITMSDLPHSPKSGGADDAGVVQTAACGEIDLCEMAAQLAQLQQMRTALLPTVTTDGANGVTETTANCGGNVTANGYSAVTSRGVCWGVEPNPTVDGSHTSDGNGMGAFSSSITGLTAGTTYYVRAYATNSVGTAYGEEVTFTMVVDGCPTFTLPYFNNFESYTTSTEVLTGVEPTCWELMREDVPMSDENRPQICCDSDYSYNSAYSLRLKYRGVYAMPALSDDVMLKDVKLEMYLQQPKKYYALEVGVWEEDGTFVPVATINNSTIKMQRVVCDFSGYTGSGRRIAFRNIPGSTTVYNYSYNFIDNLKLYIRDGVSCPGMPTVTDHEGNVYNTVQIGVQCWTKENMRTTTSPSTRTYLIPAAGTDYTCTGKQARWYDDDSTTYAPMNYGLLYNWNAAMDTFHTMYGETSVNTDYNKCVSVTVSGHRRGICPVGWHLPSDAEWTALTNYLKTQPAYICGSASYAKALASETGWESYTSVCSIGKDQSANNATGFSALPAGCYNTIGYYTVGAIASLWSATEDYHTKSYASHRVLNYGSAYVDFSYVSKTYCRSVRCLRD